MHNENYIKEIMADKGAVTGLFSMEIVNGLPHGLYIDDEICQVMALNPALDPQETMQLLISRVEPDSLQGMMSAIATCAKGVKSETKFRYNHPLVGVIDIKCTGAYAETTENGHMVRGYFKAISQELVPAETEADRELLKRMLSEAFMDVFAVCGLLDIENNTIVLLKDAFDIGKVLGGHFTYDQWKDTIAGLVAREDIEKFDEAGGRKALMHYFSITQDERQEEIRFLIPSRREYRWMKVRFVRFKTPFAVKYKEFFVFRDITENHQTEFKDSLRIKLINGLTLPYQDIDLINLKTGRMYSSQVGDGTYAEDFDLCGFADDALAKYFYMSDCTREERDELLGKFLVRNLLKHFEAGEKTVEAEVRHRNKVTGLYEWVRIQCYLSSVDEDGKPFMAIMTTQAINAEKEKQIRDQKTLEFALRAESQYKRAILSDSIAVYTYNITTDTLYDEVIETEGIRPLLPFMGLSCPCSYNEYVTRKAKYFMVAAESENFLSSFTAEALLKMYENNRHSYDMEYEFSNPDGTKAGVFRESVILTKDLQTEEIWGLTYVKNVTEESENNKRIEQTLRDAFYQAQKANSAKTLFMSQMSHDIRTPLNSILGMAAIAAEHTNDPERLKDCISKIEYSGRHLLEIINNVLDLSAIESGKTSLQTDDFDLAKFLLDTLKLIKPLADKKHHTLCCKVDRNIHTAVNGDHTKLRQLLMNVLGNAVKYTPDGGRIEFTAEQLDGMHSDYNTYMFTVTDNGIGMSEDFLNKVFDPFVRADNNRVTKVEGTGLGMAIAMNLARMMNGTIKVYSAEGKGSKFQITVDLKRSVEYTDFDYGEISMEEPVKIRMSDYDFGGIRVLLAEDLEFNAEIASEFLAEANIITEVAENGEEAVNMFSNSEAGYYSLIFMDIQMPLLDGYGAARKIRQLDRPDAATIPIIAMTANAFSKDVQNAREAGMNGHIAKPLEIARLVRELKRWFGDRKKEK